MKIFIDSANLEQIKEINSLGLLDGVTTNPSLIKRAMGELKTKMEMNDYIREICKTVGEGKHVSLEVISLTADEMVREAKMLYGRFNPVANNVVIKIPISTQRGAGDKSYEGLKAIRSLREAGIKTNATLVMTPEQALMAAKAGASYASPFAGRIDDYIRKRLGIKFEKEDYFPAEGVIKDGQKIDDNGILSGVDLVRKIVTIYGNYKVSTEVIAASLRNARQVREVAEAGAHIATIPFKVIKEMLHHPKTVEGVIKFSEDVIPEYAAIFGSK